MEITEEDVLAAAIAAGAATSADDLTPIQSNFVKRVLDNFAQRHFPSHEAELVTELKGPPAWTVEITASTDIGGDPHTLNAYLHLDERPTSQELVDQRTEVVENFDDLFGEPPDVVETVVEYTGVNDG